jgi:HEAT repeat protein
LIEALDDKNAWVKEGAAHSLRNFGPVAYKAMDPLISALDDKREAEDGTQRVCDSALEALGGIGVRASAAKSRLLTLLRGGDSNLANRAALALPLMAPSDMDVIQALISCLGDNKRIGLAGSAAWALGRIGPPAKAALPTLLSELRKIDVSRSFTDDVYINQIDSQVDAIGSIDIQAEDVQDTLAKILSNKKLPSSVRAAALHQIENGSLNGDRFVPILSQILSGSDERDEQLKRNARKALDKLDRSKE